MWSDTLNVINPAESIRKNIEKQEQAKKENAKNKKKNG